MALAILLLIIAAFETVGFLTEDTAKITTTAERAGYTFARVGKLIVVVLAAIALL